MIGIGRTVKGSASAIRYMQDDKGQAVEIDRQYIGGDTPKEIHWEMRQVQSHNTKVEKGCFSAVLSPDKEYTKNFTPEDWQELTQRFIKKMGLQDNQYIAYLHNSTDTPHLHIVANRIDFSGKNVIDRSNIHLQTQNCAKAIALENNWKLSTELKNERTSLEKSEINLALKDCLKTCRNTDELSTAMEKKGYTLHWNERQGEKTGLRILPKGKELYNSSTLTSKPAVNGFKLSEIDRKFKIKDIFSSLSANLAKAPLKAISRSLGM